MTEKPDNSARAWSFAGFPLARRNLRSFDGGETAQTVVAAPDRYRFFDSPETTSPRISRGAGLSYCGASFGPDVVSVSHASFNRILDFDSATGEVEVEAGTDLLTLHRFLAPRGFYLACQPGHGAITVGGCIAADVHGKNHARDGTFAQQVKSLEIMHPGHGVMTLTAQENADILRLTCGGLGLTGHILKARLTPKKLRGQCVRRTARVCDSFADTIDALIASQAESDYAYSWHDMSRPGSGFGRGIVHSGVITTGKVPGPPAATSSEALRRALLRRLPASGILSYQTTPLLNRLYRAKQKRADVSGMVPLEQAVFPIHGSEAYFSMFGKTGFHESQILFSVDRAPDVAAFIEDRLRRHKIAIALASAKLFGAPQDLLRFSGTGLNLALNMPRGKSALAFLADLDDFLIEIGGIPNLIKDSRISRRVAEACYPEMDEFRTRLHDFDRKRLFQSTLSRRLAL